MSGLMLSRSSLQYILQNLSMELPLRTNFSRFPNFLVYIPARSDCFKVSASFFLGFSSLVSYWVLDIVLGTMDLLSFLFLILTCWVPSIEFFWARDTFILLYCLSFICLYILFFIRSMSCFLKYC